jgi:hypothetical protein
MSEGQGEDDDGGDGLSFRLQVLKQRRLVFHVCGFDYRLAKKAFELIGARGRVAFVVT